MRGAGILAAWVVAVICCGCGTVFNTVYFTPVEGDKSVYGGVRLDRQLAKNCVSGENGFEEKGVANRAAYATAAVADIPFSAVGDTFAIPFILAFDKWYEQAEAESHKNCGKCHDDERGEVKKVD